MLFIFIFINFIQKSYIYLHIFNIKYYFIAGTEISLGITENKLLLYTWYNYKALIEYYLYIIANRKFFSKYHLIEISYVKGNNNKLHFNSKLFF